MMPRRRLRKNASLSTLSDHVDKILKHKAAMVKATYERWNEEGAGYADDYRRACDDAREWREVSEHLKRLSSPKSKNCLAGN